MVSPQMGTRGGARRKRGTGGSSGIDPSEQRRLLRRRCSGGRRPTNVGRLLAGRGWSTPRLTRTELAHRDGGADHRSPSGSRGWAPGADRRRDVLRVPDRERVWNPSNAHDAHLADVLDHLDDPPSRVSQVVKAGPWNRTRSVRGDRGCRGTFDEWASEGSPRPSACENAHLLHPLLHVVVRDGRRKIGG